MANWYASLAALRTRLNLDTSDDLMVSAILEAVSRQIDNWTGRHFYSRTATRSLSTPRPDRLLVPDLLAVTTLKTDTNGDLSYATTWAPTDYVLLPGDAPLASPPRPYWEIRPAPAGAYAFGSSLHNVQIAGRWGFSEVLVPTGATLAADLDTTETAIEVSSGAAFEIGQTIQIDAEQCFITGIATNTLTVAPRPVNGTTAAVHTTGAAIDVYTYPIISEACLLQAGRLYQNSRAPNGVTGGADFGTVTYATLHPLVRIMLQPFKLPGLAKYGD